jgi:hypothetical protein
VQLAGGANVTAPRGAAVASDKLGAVITPGAGQGAVIITLPDGV